MQRHACRSIGSLLYERILGHCVARRRRGGARSASCSAPARARPVRLRAARSASSARSTGWCSRVGRPTLAAHYPSVGGTPGPDVGTSSGTVAAHDDEIARRIDDGVQTNEVGRSASLVGGCSRSPGSACPLRVLEVGASAGLNLRWDHYRYDAGDRAFGDPAQPGAVRPALDRPAHPTCAATRRGGRARAGATGARSTPPPTRGGSPCGRSCGPTRSSASPGSTAPSRWRRRVPATVDRADGPRVAAPSGWHEPAAGRTHGRGPLDRAPVPRRPRAAGAARAIAAAGAAGHARRPAGVAAAWSRAATAPSCASPCGPAAASDLLATAATTAPRPLVWRAPDGRCCRAPTTAR